MTDFIHEKGYVPPVTDTIDFVITILEDGHGIADYHVPQAQVLAWGTAEHKNLGEVVLSSPIFQGYSGEAFGGEVTYELPQVSTQATGVAIEPAVLPQIEVNAWTGAHTDTNNGDAFDLLSGYNLPQIQVTGELESNYAVGDYTLPQIKVNIKDANFDGEEDDLIWVDTDGDGEPDTPFVQPEFVDTDGDGIPDTWVETWYQSVLPLTAIGGYNVPQIKVDAWQTPSVDYVLPQIQVAGTLEAEQRMNIEINVPKPEVTGTFQSTSPFSGVIDVPVPVVTGVIISTTPAEGVIDVPLPQVIAKGETRPVGHGTAVIDVPKPVVSGVISTGVVEETEMTFGETPQCTQ